MDCGSLFPKLKPLAAYLDSLTARMDLEVIERLLAESAVTVTDVKDACNFCDTNYQRNKIGTSGWYDLLVICWRPGQATAIHDHMGSSCGFKILAGSSTEVAYECASKKPGPNDCVHPVRQRIYKTGELCLAQDNDIHRISNDSPIEDLVTLHIYSPPLKMHCYECDPAFYFVETNH